MQDGIHRRPRTRAPASHEYGTQPANISGAGNEGESKDEDEGDCQCEGEKECGCEEKKIPLWEIHKNHF